MTTYFGFEMNATMFPSVSHDLRVDYLKATEFITKVHNPNVVVCCNSAHKATINAMYRLYGLRLYCLRVEIPKTPPLVKLDFGDRLLVLMVSGLPRLTDRHEYNDSEINQASFDFIEIEVCYPYQG